jgi:hypothetical protein
VVREQDHHQELTSVLASTLFGGGLDDALGDDVVFLDGFFFFFFFFPQQTTHQRFKTGRTRPNMGTKKTKKNRGYIIAMCPHLGYHSLVWDPAMTKGQRYQQTATTERLDESTTSKL